jgi:hypothetical protein
MPPKALRNLLKIAGDYYPNAANYNQAHFWSNTMALCRTACRVGPTRHGNVFVNVGHGATGWAASVGSARLLSDLVAARTRNPGRRLAAARGAGLRLAPPAPRRPGAHDFFINFSPALAVIHLKSHALPPCAGEPCTCRRPQHAMPVIQGTAITIMSALHSVAEIRHVEQQALSALPPTP